MKLMKGIYDCPKYDDDGKRKSPTDGCPTTRRHCRTRHVSASWNHQRNLAETARSLSSRCCGHHGVTTGVSENPVVFSSPCLFSSSGVLDLRWSDPWELGRTTAETLEATDLGWEELVAVFVCFALDNPSDLVRLEGVCKASSGTCISTESSMVSSLAFFAAFAAAVALHRFFWAVALACAAHASGNQSLQTRQGLSWVQIGCPSFKWHCWQRRWLSFLRWKWEHSGNFGCDSVDDDWWRDRSAIFHAGTAWQRRKHGFSHITYFTKISLRPTGESSDSHTTILLSSSSITPGKATGSVSDWTRVRSLARRKSKRTMGGCGALRRWGCAWTYEGTQFLCVKFRLGSAGEPTICSHCYDILNEVLYTLIIIIPI